MFPRGLGEAPVVQQVAEDIHEEPAKLVFTKTLALSTLYPDLGISVDKDSDFVLTALCGKSEGAYSINIKTASGREIFSSPAQAENAVGTGQFPIPLVPALTYPAGGRIGLSLADLSGAENDVELVLVGIRRFKAGRY
jgi:hypothetical protein